MLEANTMTVGVNYWASHAATRMWIEWNEAVVAADMKALGEMGCDWVRAFPKWDDFQPVKVLRSNCYKGGYPMDYSFAGDRPLPDTEAGRAGVDEVMLERFERLADLAHENGLKLIVPIFNGHMTFRIYAPPAVDGLDHFRDPMSLMWQQKFIACFVKRLKHHPAIYAWEIGNESNCMSVADDRATAFSWTALVTNAIRAADPGRPVFSGMHSLQGDENHGKAKWLFEDQAYCCDVLTSHPYPMWTPHINNDPANTLRFVLQAPTDNRMYATMSGKPAIVEEIGTLRRTFSTFEMLGDQLRNILWLLWTHDGRALLWWCAFDQTGMEFSPYDTDYAGMEHGTLTAKHELNPTGRALRDFSKFQKTVSVKQLPPPRRNAVCLIGIANPPNPVAQSVNIPAQQAGISLSFIPADRPTLPESKLYIAPCIERKGNLNRAAYRELARRAEEGACVYFSFNWNANVPEMESFFGFEISKRVENHSPVDLRIPGLPAMRFTPQYRFSVIPHGAEKLDEAGLVWVFRRGKGRIVTALLPLENLMLAKTESYQTIPFYKFYEWLAADALPARLLTVDDPEVIVSERADTCCVICNCSPTAKELTLQTALPFTRCESDAPVTLKDGKLHMPPNSGALLTLA